MAELDFNAQEVEPQSSFEPIPAGWYRCMAMESEWRDTRSGNGRYLQVVFEVLEGEHKGRKLWERLNLDNPNGVAVDIARRTLSALCRSVGVFQVKDSSELHGKPVLVKVAKKKRPDGDWGNEIKGYKPAPNAGASAPTRPKDTGAEFRDEPAPWAAG